MIQKYENLIKNSFRFSYVKGRNLRYIISIKTISKLNNQI